MIGSTCLLPIASSKAKSSPATSRRLNGHQELAFRYRVR
jgi:hypothetical protein